MSRVALMQRRNPFSCRQDMLRLSQRLDHLFTDDLFDTPFGLSYPESSLQIDRHLAKNPTQHQYVSHSFTTLQDGVRKSHTKEAYTDSNGVQTGFTSKQVGDKVFKEYRNGDEVNRELLNAESYEDFDSSWNQHPQTNESLTNGPVQSSTSNLEDLKAQLQDAKSNRRYQECIKLKAEIDAEEAKIAQERHVEEQRQANTAKRREIEKLRTQLSEAESRDNFEECLEIHNRITALESELGEN